MEEKLQSLKLKKTLFVISQVIFCLFLTWLSPFYSLPHIGFSQDHYEDRNLAG